MAERTFLKITNRMIYDKLEAIEKKCDRIENHATETNGKVKLNKWIATTAITLVVVALGWCLTISLG